RVVAPTKPQKTCPRGQVFGGSCLRNLVGGVLDGRLHVRGGVVDGLAVGQRRIGVVLDGLGDGRVERGHRAGRRVLQGGLQCRQVRVLLDQGLIVVDGGQHRRERLLGEGG